MMIIIMNLFTRIYRVTALCATSDEL